MAMNSLDNPRIPRTQAELKKMQLEMEKPPSPMTRTTVIVTSEGAGSGSSGGGGDTPNPAQINGVELPFGQSKTAAQLSLATSEQGTKADTAYQKPSDGVPKSDLDASVQASLGLADTALQSYTESDPTVPAWAKAAQKPSYTASEVGAATTAQGTKADSALQSSDVVNDLTTGGTNAPLSAEQGKNLQNQVINLENLGHFLGVVASKSVLPTTTEQAQSLFGGVPTQGDYADVQADETQDGKSDSYKIQSISGNAITWATLPFRTYDTEVRNFTTDPIVAGEIATNAVTAIKIADGAVTDAKIGNRTLADNAGNGTLTPIAAKSITAWFQSLRDNIKYLLSTLATHLSATNNPHGVTKAQVGLENVDNTTDTNKPVSTAQQTALDTKQNKTVTVTDDSATQTLITAGTSQVQTYLNVLRANVKWLVNFVNAGVINAANKLVTARTIALTGNVTGSTTFDGSANASISTTIVSGLKTLYGQSLIGSGDLTIPPTVNTTGFSIGQSVNQRYWKVTGTLAAWQSMYIVFSERNCIAFTVRTSAGVPQGYSVVLNPAASDVKVYRANGNVNAPLLIDCGTMGGSNFSTVIALGNGTNTIAQSSQAEVQAGSLLAKELG